MNTKILILLAVILCFMACENEETEFDDFDYTACYFPYQTPARTLILGKYELGFNDNDNKHMFEIGVTMGGVYENTEDRKVYFRYAPELLDSIDSIYVLPPAYYTIETSSPVTIPAGSTKGRIKVQLNEAFFDDTLSFAPLEMVNYVVPLLITKAENIDKILVGEPAVDNPTRVLADDWDVLPKDYTLFGIKFINKYHAMYLRRGVDVLTSADTTISTFYHEQYVEEDELVKLTTTGRNSVTLSNMIRRGSAKSPGKIYLDLLFTDDGNCTVENIQGIINNVSGSGKFMENGDSWGGKSRDVIYLQYSYTDTVNNETHLVNDTLVVRNRDVVFEQFSL